MKKAQITLFMIIGIIVLIVAAILIFTREKTAQIDSSEALARDIPKELHPIKEFVDECTFDTAKEAFAKLGIHGGYIDPFDPLYSNTEFEIDDHDPTEADAILLSEGNPGTAIPYWWYMVSDNDNAPFTVSAQNVLSVDEIEYQVNTYINQHLNDCLDDFRKFEAIGFNVRPLGDIEPITQIAENDVTISLTYPLSVSLRGRETNIEHFFIRMPLPFQDVFNLARELVITENLESYLEDFIENFIIAYSGFDTKKLPPHIASEISFSKKIWVKMEVAKDIQDILNLYVPVFQVNGTKNARTLETSNDFEAAAYRSLMLNIQNSYPDLEVKFYFFDWPIYVEITPNQGQILTALRTQRQNLILGGPIEMQEYQFYYDVSFPVVVAIRAPSSYNDEGYRFMFAMEGNLRDDKSIRDFIEGQGTIGPYTPLFAAEVDEEISQDEEYADVPGVGAEPLPKTLLCSPKQRIGSELTLQIADSITRGPIPEARVRFGCGPHAECGLGVTELDLVANTSTFIGKAPICLNGGFISIEAQNYRKLILPKLSSAPGLPIGLNVTLQRYVNLNVSVKKILVERTILYRDDLEDYGGTYKTVLEPTTPSSPDMDDQIILQIKPVSEFPINSEKAQLVYLNPAEPAPALEKVQVLPGLYEISAQYFDPNEVFIPAEFRCYDGDCDDQGVWIPEKPGVTLDVFPAGGVEINAESGLWEITESDLEGAQYVEIPIFAIPIPVIVEDLADMSAYANLSVDYREMIEPRIS